MCVYVYVYIYVYIYIYIYIYIIYIYIYDFEDDISSKVLKFPDQMTQKYSGRLKMVQITENRSDRTKCPEPLKSNRTQCPDFTKIIGHSILILPF